MDMYFSSLEKCFLNRKIKLSSHSLKFLEIVWPEGDRAFSTESGTDAGRTEWSPEDDQGGAGSAQEAAATAA